MSIWAQVYTNIFIYETIFETIVCQGQFHSDVKVFWLSFNLLFSSTPAIASNYRGRPLSAKMSVSLPQNFMYVFHIGMLYLTSVFVSWSHKPPMHYYEKGQDIWCFVVFTWSGCWQNSRIAMIWDTMTFIWRECNGLICNTWIWRYNVLIIYPPIGMLTLLRLQYFMDCCIFCPVSGPILEPERHLFRPFYTKLCQFCGTLDLATYWWD